MRLPPLPWPVWLDTAATALPFAAAWAAGRRSWDDAAGRVGIAWGVLFLCGALQVGAYTLGKLAGMRVGNAGYLVLAPLVLTPALLAWVGGPLRRRAGVITLVLTLWGVGALLVLGVGRRATLLYTTPLHLLLLVLSLLVLAAQGRRAADPLSDRAEPGWMWVGGGHVLYFLTYTVGRPMVELLVPRGLSAMVDAHMATMILYSVAQAAIAWGIWLGRAPRGASSNAAAIPTPG